MFTIGAFIHALLSCVTLTSAGLSCLFLSSPTAKNTEPILMNDSSYDAVSRKEVHFWGS